MQKLILLLLLVFASPLLLLFSSWLPSESNSFGYFYDKGLMSEYFFNSIINCILTVLISCTLAIPTAWWTSMYEFPGRRFFSWALVLPLAVPPYIAAIVYGDLLDEAGSVQYLIRSTFDLQYGDYWFFQIHSVFGMALVLALTIYPYLYLLLRASFRKQGVQSAQTAMMLGFSRFEMFFSLILPMARPALVAGSALILMEALADFGVASLFGIPVFTTGIYRAWTGFFDPVAAGRMATLLLGFVLVVLWLERTQRKGNYQQETGSMENLQLWRSNGWKSWFYSSYCFTVLFFGFLVPIVTLLYWSYPNLSAFVEPRNIEILKQTLIIAFLSSSIVLVLAVICSYLPRIRPSVQNRLTVALTTIGYSIPGSVVAVGVLIVLLELQSRLFDGAMIFTGTILGILWGCSLRFNTIGYKSISAGMEQISRQLDETATLLGKSDFSRFFLVHLPILRKSIVVCLVLVFIETLKELPATILLRPFDVNTLAIRIYELAGDEMPEVSAPLALILVSLSIIPLLLVHWQFETDSNQ